MRRSSLDDRIAQLLPALLSPRDFVREERLTSHVRARLVYKDPTLLASLEVAEVLGEIRNMRSKLATLNYECKTVREGGQKSGRVLQ